MFLSKLNHDDDDADDISVLLLYSDCMNKRPP